MTNSKNTVITGNKALRDEARGEQKNRDTGLWAAVILFPITIAVLGTISASLWKFHWTLAVIAWVFVILLYGLTWWRSFPQSKSFLALALENSDLRAEILTLEHTRKLLLEDLENSEIRQSQKSVAAFSLRGMSISYIQQGISSREELKEMLDDILAPLYLTGGELLGFKGTESWSFSVYLYSASEDKLLPVWREKSRNHPSQGESRAWGRGEGHVGKTFVDKETIFTADGQETEVAKLIEAKGKARRDYDASAYRSFASIPFGASNNSSENGFPAGVLVGTSNEAGRFDWESTELLQHFGESIGVIVALTHLNIDCFTGQTGIKEEQGDGK